MQQKNFPSARVSKLRGLLQMKTIGTLGRKHNLSSFCVAAHRYLGIVTSRALIPGEGGAVPSVNGRKLPSQFFSSRSEMTIS